MVVMTLFRDLLSEVNYFFFVGHGEVLNK